MLTPAAAIEIGRVVVEAESDHERTIAAVRRAISLLRHGLQLGSLDLTSRESGWLDRIDESVYGLPSDERDFLDELQSEYGELLDLGTYGL